jgi:DNA-binding HxlR family transcriptional regulator
VPGQQAARADRGAAAATERATTPLDVALERVGDRWSLLLVEALLEGPRRFGDLQRQIPGIAPNILSERLKRLERERVLSSRPYSERPPRFTYELTADGRELAGALRLLADWGARGSQRAEPLRHEPCGTPLEARWYCPTCARPVEGQEIDQVRFV